MKFGIIGFGNIGTRHAHFIQENSETELVAICDIEAEALHRARQLGVTVYQNYSDLLLDGTIDVISVCTPNYLHAEHSIASLESGKHVLCEKPMCMSTDEADRMIEASKDAQKEILVVKQNRYNESVDWLHQLINSGKLGKIYTVSVRAYWNRNKQYYEQSDWRGDPIKDGGCLYTQFSHFIDILYFLLGDVTVIQGECRNDNHPYIQTEDSGTFFLHSKEGARISFQYSTCAFDQNMEGSITLLAENGSVQIGGKYLNELVYAQVKDVIIPPFKKQDNPNLYRTGYEGTMSNHDKVIQNVVEAVHGKAQIKTSAIEGKQVVSIIQNMYATAGRL